MQVSGLAQDERSPDQILAFAVTTLSTLFASRPSLGGVSTSTVSYDKLAQPSTYISSCESALQKSSRITQDTLAALSFSIVLLDDAAPSSPMSEEPVSMMEVNARARTDGRREAEKMENEGLRRAMAN